MNVYINPKYIFKNIKDQNKIQLYTQRLEKLIRALDQVKGKIPQKIIDQFKMKKMIGTSDIFKFYLSTDGTRCLFQYGRDQSLVFENQSALYILRAVDHDNQGILGRKLDGELGPLEDFLLYDREDNNIDNSKVRTALNQELDKQIMKAIPLSYVKKDELLEKMYEIDNRSMYRLSENQQLALIAEGPLFIRGSAGSGKTLVAISKALKNAHEKTLQGYFTYTPLLTDNAKQLYNKYANMKGIKGKVSFNTMNEYFIKELKLSAFQHFTFANFANWMYKNQYRANYKWMSNLDVVQIWTEIRGLIKGYIGRDYYRILTIDNNSNIINRNELRTLVANEVLIKAPNSSTIYYILNSSELYRRYQGTKLHEHLLNNDVNTAIIDEYSYVEALVSGYSPFDKKTRKKLLNFVNNIYQPYLEKHNYYDDNDLARMLIKKISKGEGKKFDYVIIDEVQDLTEMQIISLTKLVNNYNNILMAGDNSQVINPTFFKSGRTGLIFRNIHNVTLNTSMQLNENFRNSEEIVKVIQRLLEIRQSKLGKYSDDIEEKYVDLFKDDGLAFFVKLDEKIMNKEIGLWIDVPKVAVIVSNEETKTKLKRKFNIIGETNIFTVHEIKGQEFSKIITYNIISDYQKHWDHIMDGKVNRGGDLVTEYKYYFNLFYVAITRGRDNIFVYEKNSNSKIINSIIDILQLVDFNTKGVLDVSDLDTKQNTIQQANQYFYNGQYLRAKSMYLRLNNTHMITLCDAYNNIYNEDNITKGLISLINYEQKYIEQIYPLIDKDKHLLMYAIYTHKLNKLNIRNIHKIIKHKSLVTLANQLKKQAGDNYLSLLAESLDLMSKIKQYRINTLLEGGEL